MENNTKSKKIKSSKSQRIVLIVGFVVFGIYAITLIYPFVWAFLNSLKTNNEYFSSSFDMPKDWLFSNYIRTFKQLEVENTNLFGMFANSIWLTVGGTVLSVLSASVTAYVVCKYDFKLKAAIYFIAVFVQIIPIIGNLPASYKLMSQLGLINNPVGIMVTWTGGLGINFFIMYGYFKSISFEYAEAAFVDGATDYAVFFKIMLPQAKPAILSLSILCAIGIWNDYMTPFLYLDKYPTLALGLYQFESMQYYRSDYPIYFAGLIISTIPILILFAAFQNTIMQNTTTGGLKG